MDDATKNAIYDVLVEECGAYDSADERAQFAFHFPDCREYRFQGRLGFGGKVWFNPSPRRRSLYVNCYPENKNKVRAEMIRRANERLAAVGGLQYQNQNGERAAGRVEVSQTHQTGDTK